jgi:hypothetical protein
MCSSCTRTGDGGAGRRENCSEDRLRTELAPRPLRARDRAGRVLARVAAQRGRHSRTKTTSPCSSCAAVRPACGWPASSELPRLAAEVARLGRERPARRGRV